MTTSIKVNLENGGQTNINIYRVYELNKNNIKKIGKKFVAKQPKYRIIFTDIVI